MTVVHKVMSTVTAPYSVAITAGELADKIADMHSAETYDCSVFAFLSEVSPALQHAFIAEMNVDKVAVERVASRFSELAGYKMPLAG